MDDRDYLFLAKTFDSSGVGRADAVDVFERCCMSFWRAAHASGRLLSLSVWEKLGDINLQTESTGVRDWNWFVIGEIASEEDTDQFVHDEVSAGITPDRLGRWGVEYLSSELVIRPRGAGTAIPRPSSHHPQLPPGQTGGIEYIDIPSSRWRDYQIFMRDVFGPIGCWLLDNGASHQITITERLKVFHHHHSLPAWNRIHILTGDFGPEGNFFAAVEQAVHQLVGPDETVQSALAPANSYRRKPRMSNSRLANELSLPLRAR